MRQPNWIAVSPDGAHLYVAGSFDNTMLTFRRDTATGRLTFLDERRDGIGGVDGLGGAFSVSVSPDGANIYVASLVDDAIAVFQRNPTTGSLTFVEARR